MLFVDDIILVDESEDRANAKLERWRETLEFKSFKISHSKKEYMDCNFIGHIQSGETTMIIEV